LLPVVDKISEVSKGVKLVRQLSKNKKLASRASQIASDDEVIKALDYDPLRISTKQRANLRMPFTNAGLAEAAEAVENPINLSRIARDNSQIVGEAGNINMRNLVRAR
jgi:hypothetical protein